MVRYGEHRWDLRVPTPPREIFAVMEQMTGTLPYRFEVVGRDEARIVEFRRRGFFGQWTEAGRHPCSMSCTARETPDMTEVRITAWPTGGRRSRAPRSRAVQLVTLLSHGAKDPRTVYRDRRIPPGPVTLVASWAGTPYALFREPHIDARRGMAITTASPLEAIPGGDRHFTMVRLPTGETGYVETDQIVAAPSQATREAQAEAARFV